MPRKKQMPTDLPRGVFEKIHGSGIYWIRWADAAGKLRRARGGNTIKSSLAKLNKLKGEKLDGILPESKKEPAPATIYTLGDLIDGAIKNTKTNLAAHDLKLKLERIRSSFGNRPADSIIQDEIIGWLDDEMEERDWEPASRNRYQAAWSLIYRVGIQNKKATANPASGIPKLRENNSRVRSLGMEEEIILKARIEKYCPSYVPIFELNLHSGMRKSELLRGVVGDLDPVTEMLAVHQRKAKNAPALRYVPLSPIGVAAYNKLSAGKKKGAPLCTNIAGAPMGDLRYWLSTAIKSVNLIDFNPHDIRHTAASRWVMAGVPLPEVAGYLGHSNIQMTMRYSHLQPGHKDRANAAMMSYYETKKTEKGEETDSKTDTASAVGKKGQ